MYCSFFLGRLQLGRNTHVKFQSFIEGNPLYINICVALPVSRMEHWQARRSGAQVGADMLSEDETVVSSPQASQLGWGVGMSPPEVDVGGTTTMLDACFTGLSLSSFIR